jgi:predicted transcriptional regulator
MPHRIQPTSIEAAEWFMNYGHYTRCEKIIISYIYSHGQATCYEISKAHNIERSTLSGILRPMEDEGKVYKADIVKNPKSGRKNFSYRLTPETLDMLDKLKPA